MLNTPNEWHNEDEIEEYVDEDFSDDYGTDYDSDTNFTDFDDSDYDNSFEDGEELEEEEINDTEGSDGSGEEKNNKKLLIIIILILLLLGCGAIFLVSKILDKASQKANVETTINEEGATTNGDEVEIDVENEDEPEITIEEGEGDSNKSLEVPEKAANGNDESGLEIEADKDSATFAEKPKAGEDVTIAIGDVGRKNPFAPTESRKQTKQATTAKSNNEGYDFDIIEPPALAPEDTSIARLLETKVTGIMYDAKRPSAIINIDGTDQLVRIGDILGGFEFVAITKNKVIIRSDNNIYRASVGQPLTAEKITNPVEISNLESKFWGSVRH
jgi:hypothetical protein